MLCIYHDEHFPDDTEAIYYWCERDKESMGSINPRRSLLLAPLIVLLGPWQLRPVSEQVATYH